MTITEKIQICLAAIGDELEYHNNGSGLEIYVNELEKKGLSDRDVDKCINKLAVDGIILKAPKVYFPDHPLPNTHPRYHNVKIDVYKNLGYVLDIDKDRLLEVSNQLAISATNSTLSTEGANYKPFTSVESEFGFFQFSKGSKRVKIGGKDSKPFKLMECFCNPFGVAKTIEAVFDSIKSEKNMQDSAIAGFDVRVRRQRMVEIINNSGIKELQKISELRRKVKFIWDGPKTKLWMEVI